MVNIGEFFRGVGLRGKFLLFSRGREGGPPKPFLFLYPKKGFICKGREKKKLPPNKKISFPRKLCNFFFFF